MARATAETTVTLVMSKAEADLLKDVLEDFEDALLTKVCMALQLADEPF